MALKIGGQLNTMVTLAWEKRESLVLNKWELGETP
jgi:hypothetical protein